MTDRGISTFPILDFTAPPNLEQFRALCSGFDLVLANTLVMWSAVCAARDANRPVIWYIHESQLLWRLLELNPEIKSALTLADLLIFPTRSTAEIYRPLTATPIEVLRYGIPPVKVQAKAERDRSRIHFLLLGSYEPRKGQDLFLRAIAQLPETTTRLTSFQMIGRKLDQPFFETLAQQAEEHRNLTLSDALEHEEALVALAAVDVLVCASRDETMPLAILEAMSLGKAVITTNVGGTRQWLRDGFNALVVPADNSQALADAIRRCAEEARLRDSLGKNARRTFAAEFSLDRLGRDFADLIERVRREKKA
jgi:glycosyltransferase involved in cell wall biosynthesis